MTLIGGSVVKESLLRCLGPHAKQDDFISLQQTSDGRFCADGNFATFILSTSDGKVEFIFFKDHVLAYVKSAMGYPAYYPLRRVEMKTPVKAVLMDLDGTTVRSEEFWIWIIQLTMTSLSGNSSFALEEEDLPYVSGHSVSEHLGYCIGKYCPDKTIEQARKFYFEHTHYQMQEIMKGRGRINAFKPSPGLREFLLELKSRHIKIGLVTSGLYEKAWPEILSAFRTLGMGDPKAFYDAIITAGFPLCTGSPGTLGELSPKPHPWLYAEVCRVGLGILETQNCSVAGIEDSGAGVCSLRLAGFPTIGFDGGNIIESGTQGLCDYYCHSFEEILSFITVSNGC
jgi:beta-phosphoglucomutase-like phosphatase (HAD superfamily)